MTAQYHQYHAVVWIDHREARVIYLAVDGAPADVVRPVHPPRRLYAKSEGSIAPGADKSAFYDEIIGALADAEAILVAGPSTAKTEFVKYLHQHSPQMLDRIWGIETLARVTDYQLLAEGRRYFANTVPKPATPG